MERRHFLKIALGVVAGAAAVAASARAAPLLPQPLGPDLRPPAHQDADPAVSNDAEVEHLTPEQVRWGHHWHGGHHWHHRHWGWHHRHWHHRHWGWRHRWHRHHWHRRYW